MAPKPKPKAKPKPAARSVIEQPIDPLATEDMAENVASLYFTAANNKHKAVALQVANGDEDDDPVPGLNPKTGDDGLTMLVENGKPVYVTYAEHIGGLQAQADRLKEHFKTIWPTVEKLIEKRKQKIAEENA